ncbi:MAG: flagellar biosynthetic protein FliR [Thermodesulfobacteriota bacterium]|nr:flagellar biosynthetic protein FliR [Thermodesulfobacteriota bacterium]
MDILNFSFEQFQVFLLILTRVGIVLFMFPVFDSSAIPNTVKAGFALIFALNIFSLVNVDAMLFPTGMVQAALMVAAEIIIGMTLGLAVRLFFAGIQLGARMVGFQMGFGIVNVMDPQTGQQISLIEQISFWSVFVIFVLLNGHYALLMALTDSFGVIPVGLVSLSDSLLDQMIAMSSEMFVFGIKTGAPAIAALFFTSVGFGLCAKFMPQMNILIIGFPVKIAVGLVFLALCLETILIFTRIYVDGLPALLGGLTRMLGG